jgi:hypothetical protein
VLYTLLRFFIHERLVRLTRRTSEKVLVLEIYSCISEIYNSSEICVRDFNVFGKKCKCKQAIRFLLISTLVVFLFSYDITKPNNPR